MTDVLQTLAGVVLPAFLVIGVGTLLGRTFAPDLTSINRVALYGAVPALVFDSLSTSELAPGGIGVLLAGNALYLLAMGALALLVGGRLAPASRRGLIATSMFSNAANIMLPVTLFAFGDEGLQRALVLYVFSAVMLFTGGPLVLGGIGGDASGVRRALGNVARLAVMWAALLGVAFNVTTVSLPTGVQRGIGILGDAAIPLVLIALGLQVHRMGLQSPRPVNLMGTLLKLGVGPLVGYVAGWIVGARGLDLAVLTLLAGMPPAVNNFMLAVEFGGESEEVAVTVILSTFTALVSVAVVLSLLRGVVG